MFSSTTGCGTTLFHMCVICFINININIKGQSCANSGTNMQTCVSRESCEQELQAPDPSAAAHPTSPTATLIHPKERGFPALPNASSSCRQHQKSVALPVEVQHPAVLLSNAGFFKEALQDLTSEFSPRGSPQSTSASQTGTSGQQRQQELGKGQNKALTTPAQLSLYTLSPSAAWPGMETGICSLGL